MKKKTATILVVLAAVAVIAYFGITAVVKKLESNLEHLVELPAADIDLFTIADGVYTGEYKAFPVSARVEVVITDHAITGIKLIDHGHGRGAAAEVIPSKVVEAQTLEVDVIAGATYSSKVILKAIENALLNAGK